MGFIKTPNLPFYRDNYYYDDAGKLVIFLFYTKCFIRIHCKAELSIVFACPQTSLAHRHTEKKVFFALDILFLFVRWFVRWCIQLSIFPLYKHFVPVYVHISLFFLWAIIWQLCVVEEEEKMFLLLFQSLEKINVCWTRINSSWLYCSNFKTDLF